MLHSVVSSVASLVDLAEGVQAYTEQQWGYRDIDIDRCKLFVISRCREVSDIFLYFLASIHHTFQMIDGFTTFKKKGERVKKKKSHILSDKRLALSLSGIIVDELMIS